MPRELGWACEQRSLQSRMMRTGAGSDTPTTESEQSQISGSLTHRSWAYIGCYTMILWITYLYRKQNKTPASYHKGKHQFEDNSKLEMLRINLFKQTNKKKHKRKVDAFWGGYIFKQGTELIIK